MRDLPEILGRLSLATSVAIVIADPEGRVQWCNPAFFDLSGCGRTDVAGRSLAEVLCGRPTNRNTRAALGQAIETATAVTLKILNCRGDATRFRIQADVTPLRDESGNVTHFAALAQEIRSGAQEVLREESVVIDLYRTLFAITETSDTDPGRKWGRLPGKRVA